MKQTLSIILLSLLIITGSAVPGIAQKTKKEIRHEKHKEQQRSWDEYAKRLKEGRRLNRKMRNQTYHFKLINATSNDSMTYKDDNISVSFDVDNGISFILENKLDTTITIVWNDASVIMPEGISEKIIHTGIKFIKRGESMLNTVVPPNAKIDDRIVPINNIEWKSDDWEITPMFGNGGATKVENNNKTFSLFLPVKLPSGEKNYNFKFKIEVY